jgi:L-threonylcarbamoyladenylate synthase
MPENTLSPQIADALALIRAGGLVAIPTETVYGLAADAKNVSAVEKIFALKGRPANHPLIVHIAGAGQLADWARVVPATATQLAEAFWPGPLTLILKKRADVPDAVTGGQDTVGLRCPNSAQTLALLRAFGGGLAAPSANRFGHVSPTTAQHVRDEFAERTPYILDGGHCEVGIESTIVDLSGGQPRILREGQIRRAQLLPYLPALQSGESSASPRVSGSLEAHYAPRTPMQMRPRHAFAETADQDCAVLALGTVPEGWRGICLPSNADEYARGLYAGLRQLDALRTRLIVIEQTPESAEWLAVNDRIKRALAGAGGTP